jgi:hypothetical protein
MPALLADLFPFLYALCFLALLWQAFRIMSRGFKAASGPLERPTGAVLPTGGRGDRTGQLTVHPELLDADGQLTREDLLTVRFSGDNEPTPFPGDPA